MKAHNIYTDTPLVPYIIAERAIWNVLEGNEKYNKSLPLEMATIVHKLTQPLCDKAEHIYKVNENFRKQLNDKRKDCRYTLEMFMEHWTHKLLKDLKN